MSRRNAVTVVRQLYNFLKKTGYLIFNPFDQVSGKVPLLRGEGAPQAFGDRSLTEAQWEDIVRHIDHIAQLGGAAYVGFGSDFDGIERTPLDCTGPQDVPRILDALRALGYPEETVRGIAGENFIAYFERLEA